MKSVFSKSLYIIIAIIINLIIKGEVNARMIENTVNLPKIVGTWTRPDTARIIDSTNIFSYMDGAGELYLAYGFDHIKVYEYTSEQQKKIDVEVYIMKTPNDAFGLLSLDWSGKPVDLSFLSESKAKSFIAPSTRALYHGGLLLLCTGNIFARIMAYQETTESKDAVLSLGNAIVNNNKKSDEPEILKILPESFNSKWMLQNDRIAYLRSIMVLNSFYYLSHQNILNLDHSTEAIIAPYKDVNNSSKQVQLLIIKYASIRKAKQALKHFYKIYLPEHKIESSIQEMKKINSDFFKIEDGWLGYMLEDEYLTFVFECPDKKNAEIIIKNISTSIKNKENSNEKK
jgi:hypothetical protein